MRIAVISSCTAEKTVECPNPLRQEDFADPARRRRREQELQSLACAAADLYAGDQHRYVMTALGLLRKRFGADAARLWIVSAGYGLVTERQQLIPYEVTFNTMSVREMRSWAQHLGLSQAVRDAVSTVPLVFFLLGDRYLSAIAPLPSPTPSQRFVYFTKPSRKADLVRSGVTAISAGGAEAARFGAGYVALKGKMFWRLATGFVREGDSLLEAVRLDDTGRAIERAFQTDE